MDKPIHGRLKAKGRLFGWLLEPSGSVNEAGRAFLLGQMLGAPAAAVMGAFCAATVAAVALLRTGGAVYQAFLVLELGLLVWRLVEWSGRSARLRAQPGQPLAIDQSILLSTLWCALQGGLAFTIMAGADPVTRVLAATLAMALIGPLCARNYAAPRFAFLLVLLLDLPFVAGALMSGEPWLAVIAPITPPFLLGAMQIIMTFHKAMLTTLAAEARNLHLAHHDSLTGVLNRQGMDDALSRIAPHADRSMALLCIDLDGFKQVNDIHGHGAGDLLLIQVAQRICAALRESDMVARMGGDEFVAVVRDMTPEEVAPLVDRLIAVIAEEPFVLNDHANVCVGASIGFACLPEDAASATELRLRADQALYEAKGAGKGVGRRYRVAPEDGEPTPRRLRAVGADVARAAQERRRG